MMKIIKMNKSGQVNDTVRSINFNAVSGWPNAVDKNF